MNPRRRRFCAAIAGLVVVAAPIRAAERLLATPRQSAGPFYPPQLPLDDDNDLTQVVGRTGRALGHSTDLSGRIVDINGRALSATRIEIWQCDANGRYRHPHERSSREPDPNFQGHGHTLTDAQGNYRFRTIRPVPYPGRTPHIHVAVFPDGEAPFVTQLYVEGEPRNSEDFLFNRVSAERRHLVLTRFEPARGADAELRARFDIVIGGRAGTPAA